MLVPPPTIQSRPKNVFEVLSQACERGWSNVWFFTDICIMITGLVANIALLWLLLHKMKPLSASQVLGVNLAAMDLIYISVIPVTWISDLRKQMVNVSAIASTGSTTPQVEDARDILTMFNVIGCPLLLACMCVERYLAVNKPVLYLRVRKWEYRMAVSAVIWCVTVLFCLAAGLLKDITIILVPVSIIISCLFVVMLICLGGVLQSLRQQSPAHTTYGNHRESPLKRRAVGNVLVVVVPAIITYGPVLVLVPLIIYLYYGNGFLNQALCNALELSVLFPNFGVLIGPLFYLSKARQTWCLSGSGKKFNE